MAEHDTREDGKERDKEKDMLSRFEEQEIFQVASDYNNTVKGSQ
jgi:hypothetical protein